MARAKDRLATAEATRIVENAVKDRSGGAADGRQGGGAFEFIQERAEFASDEMLDV